MVVRLILRVVWIMEVRLSSNTTYTLLNQELNYISSLTVYLYTVLKVVTRAEALV